MRHSGLIRRFNTQIDAWRGGIPTQRLVSMKTYYDVLDVSASASQVEIRETYRILSEVWHPDRFGTSGKKWDMANQKMKEINAAFDVLKDPHKRAEYDFILMTWQRNASHPPAGPDTTSERPERTRINPTDGVEMIRIPEGQFLMGDPDIPDNPPHVVTLSEFWIYKDVVNVSMYKRFCRETGGRLPHAPDFNPNWSNEAQPIVSVRWGEAQAYAQWAGVRLPTEAQWEKAARCHWSSENVCFSII